MKTVVVTGSTRGIGLGLAENFLRRGCNVVVSGRNPETVEDIAAQLGAAFEAQRVAGRACDITDGAALQGLWDLARERFGRVDIWINNAGISIHPGTAVGAVRGGPRRHRANQPHGRVVREPDRHGRHAGTGRRTDLEHGGASAATG